MTLRGGFAKRIYLYNYRIFDRYDCEVISLAPVTDGTASANQMTWPHERGFSRAEIHTFFRFIDWVRILPEEMEQKLKTEIHQYEENKRMPYISSWERFAMEEGRLQGLEQGLEQGARNVVLRLLSRRLGRIGADDKQRIAELSLTQLDKLSEALLDFTQAQDLTRWLNRHARRRSSKRTK